MDSYCVNTGGGRKIIFGEGTRLYVESSKLYLVTEIILFAGIGTVENYFKLLRN